jgi:hypothetical protein
MSLLLGRVAVPRSGLLRLAVLLGRRLLLVGIAVRRGGALGRHVLSVLRLLGARGLLRRVLLRRVLLRRVLLRRGCAPQVAQHVALPVVPARHVALLSCP